MSSQNIVGTASRPLRVAIIGSGPSGFYAADALLKTKALTVEVDVFDRLPTPYGLVRAGVAPDHQKIKKVAKTYERTAAHEGFRFIGNARLGASLTLEDLAHHYDQVVYAVGADAGRELNVPGRGALRYHPAAVIVGWYNGHPDFRRARHDFEVERVVIIGHGNVALDISRIFAKNAAELAETDIASHALKRLANKKIRDIYVVGRGGPADATFTPSELKEYAGLADAVALVEPSDVAATPELEAQLAAANKTVRANVKVLRDYASQAPKAAEVRVHFVFNATTDEVLVDEQGAVRGVRFERTETRVEEDGKVTRGTGETFELEVGMVIPAIGFSTTPIPGVPFDTDAQRISNVDGRVTDAETGEVVRNHYTVGWAATGPRGVIGVHKAASRAVVKRMLADLQDGHVAPRALPLRSVIIGTLEARGATPVSFDDWMALDALEVARGEARGAPREKFSSVDDMLDAVHG